MHGHSPPLTIRGDGNPRLFPWHLVNPFLQIGMGYSAFILSHRGFHLSRR